VEPAGPVAHRALLALCVLDDIDVEPTAGGWTLVRDDGLALALSPAELATAVDRLDPESDEARAALRQWTARRFDLAGLDAAALAARARPVALPVGHVLHPGARWTVRTVLGGVLDVGLGLRGDVGDPEAVAVLHPVMAEALGVHHGAMVERAWRYLRDMGQLAAERVLRDPVAPLRPLGDCDVLTLLASPEFRASLVRIDPTGMRTAAIPMRHRGWLDLGRVDPGFALAAAACTDPPERGFDRPVLITRDEVVLARAGGSAFGLGARDAVTGAAR